MNERQWKLGDDCLKDDVILDAVTFNDLILAVRCNCQNKTREAVIQTAKEILSQRKEDFWFLIENNIQEIIDIATPEEEKNLKLARPAEELEALAWEIQRWLSSYNMWQDVSIYYAGKRMSTHKETNGKNEFRYNGDPFIEEGFNPKDYCEYANPAMITMTFEGPFYEVMNGYCPGWTVLEEEFSRLINKHGFYYELGHAWSLSLYEA